MAHSVPALKLAGLSKEGSPCCTPKQGSVLHSCDPLRPAGRERRPGSSPCRADHSAGVRLRGAAAILWALAVLHARDASSWPPAPGPQLLYPPCPRSQDLIINSRWGCRWLKLSMTVVPSSVAVNAQAAIWCPLLSHQGPGTQTRWELDQNRGLSVPREAPPAFAGPTRLGLGHSWQRTLKPHAAARSQRRGHTSQRGGSTAVTSVPTCESQVGCSPVASTGVEGPPGAEGPTQDKGSMQGEGSTQPVEPGEIPALSTRGQAWPCPVCCHAQQTLGMGTHACQQALTACLLPPVTPCGLPALPGPW